MTSTGQKPRVFPVYLECEVGGKSKDELIAEIEALDMYVLDWARSMMSQPAWKPGEHERVKFARIEVRDLGFTKDPTTIDLLVCVRESGNSLCKPCDGPAIRLALSIQSYSDMVWIAMEPIIVSNRYPQIFTLGRLDDGRLWLFADWASKARHLNDEVIFRLGQ